MPLFEIGVFCTSPHIKNRDLIELKQLFDMVIGQIAARQDQIDIFIFFVSIPLQKVGIDPVADGEYF